MKKIPVMRIVRSGYYIPTIILFLFLLYVAALVFHYNRQVAQRDAMKATGHSPISKSNAP